MVPSQRLLLTVLAGLMIWAAMVLEAKAATAAQDPVEIRVEGTSLRVRLSDGRELTGTALAGAVLTIADVQGAELQVRIDGAERDPEDPAEQRWLYSLSAYDPSSESWHTYCHPGPEGRRLAFPVSGTTNDQGGFELSADQLTFTCTSGALAKCIRWGYEPWATSDDGQSLLDPFRACMRMVRADYCGDGLPHTRDGTLINVYDRVGVQASEPSPELTFEAAWAPDGAVCVRKTRIGEVWTLDQLTATCPERFAGRVGPACTEAEAMSLPDALIFNDSRD